MPAPVTSGVTVAALLRWYDRHRRRLPWRAGPDEAADPYRVWLSEIMLQQTTVAAVIPYYERFLRLFPDIASLAAAPLEAVLGAWAGLGYYARARNLHACAQVLAAGGFPRDLAGLRALPGFGEYTAAAVGAIAFGISVVPVDGNVARVLARVHAETAPLPAALPLLRRLAARLAEDPAAAARPSDTAQALFDLGATLCNAAPACGLCPWREGCRGHAEGIAVSLPRRAARVARPQRHGAQFWLTDAAGRVLLRRRPPSGLLGRMTELPGVAWRADPWTPEEALAWACGLAAGVVWRRAAPVAHVFTHFALHLDVYVGRAAAIAVPPGGFLVTQAGLAAAAMPSVMRKCVHSATDATRSGQGA